MDRIFMILKKKLTLPLGYKHRCIHMNITVKQIYWYISKISVERLQDHWSSGSVYIFYHIVTDSCGSLLLCGNSKQCCGKSIQSSGVANRF